MKYLRINKKINFQRAIISLSNKENLGYGGNQKIGYQYAIINKFNFVVLLHGDGQYAPEYLPKIIEEFKNNENCAVFGSRMIKRGSALKGGMPLYKFVGNRILWLVLKFFKHWPNLPEPPVTTIFFFISF